MSTPAADAGIFRSQLNLALQEHAYLLAEAVYAQLGGRQAGAAAASETLRRENTPHISDLIGIGLTVAGRDGFAVGWHDWTETVIAYAAALQSGNEQRAAAIWGDRFRQGQRLSKPLEDGLEALDRSVLRRSMEQHVELTLGMVRIMHEEPPINGYWGAWHNTEFLQPIGDQLAEAVVQQVPDRFTPLAVGTPLTTQTSAAALRSDLALFLHEYGLLLTNATAAIVDGRIQGDSSAAKQTLDARNSIPLSRVIGSFAPSAEAEFLELWRQHTYAVAGFAEAVRDGDEEGQRMQRERLDTVFSDLADLLLEIAPNASRAGLDGVLRRHADVLLDAIATQQAATAGQRYIANIGVARESQVLADVLTEMLLAQYPDRVAVEDAIYGMTLAWNQASAEDYLGHWTDAGIGGWFGLSRGVALQQLRPVAGSPVTVVRKVLGVGVTGSRAVIEWEVMSGIALQQTRATLVKADGTWRVESLERQNAPIPSGVNRVITITVQDSGMLFNPILINGGYIGFRAENLGRQPYDIALVMMDTGGPLVIEANGQVRGGSILTSTGALQPGQSGNLGFGVPLETGRYALVRFEVGPDGSSRAANALAIQFSMPMRPAGSEGFAME
ncbi:MAG: hypothetical protein WD645_04540 [Dehalococcoidia bacterium]